METLLERIEDVEDDLMSRAFLYDVPAAYREGVEAALVAVRAAVATSESTSAARRTA